MFKFKLIKFNGSKRAKFKEKTNTMNIPFEMLNDLKPTIEQLLKEKEVVHEYALKFVDENREPLKNIDTIAMFGLSQENPKIIIDGTEFK